MRYGRKSLFGVINATSPQKYTHTHTRTKQGTRKTSDGTGRRTESTTIKFFQCRSLFTIQVQFSSTEYVRERIVAIYPMALSFSRVAKHKQFGCQWIKYCMVEFDFSFAFICLRARTNAFWMAVSRKLVDSIIECTVKLYTKLQRERTHIHDESESEEESAMWLYRTHYGDETKTKPTLAHIILCTCVQFAIAARVLTVPLSTSLPRIHSSHVCRISCISITHTLAMEFNLNTFEMSANVIRSYVWIHSLSCRQEKCVLEHAEHMHRIQTFAQRFGSQALSLLAKHFLRIISFLRVHYKLETLNDCDWRYLYQKFNTIESGC